MGLTKVMDQVTVGADPVRETSTTPTELSAFKACSIFNAVEDVVNAVDVS